MEGQDLGLSHVDFGVKATIQSVDQASAEKNTGWLQMSSKDIGELIYPRTQVEVAWREEERKRERERAEGSFLLGGRSPPGPISRHLTQPELDLFRKLGSLFLLFPFVSFLFFFFFVTKSSALFSRLFQCIVMITSPNYIPWPSTGYGVTI